MEIQYIKKIVIIYLLGLYALISIGCSQTGANMMWENKKTASYVTTPNDELRLLSEREPGKKYYILHQIIFALFKSIIPKEYGELIQDVVIYDPKYRDKTPIMEFDMLIMPYDFCKQQSAFDNDILDYPYMICRIIHMLGRNWINISKNSILVDLKNTRFYTEYQNYLKKQS